MRQLSLESSLPILQSKAKTIVLLSNQLSLMTVIQNPTPAKIVSGAQNLYDRCVRQDYFNVDFWGESVKKINKAELIRDLELQIQGHKYRATREYDNRIIAANMSVRERIRSTTHADFFDIRSG